MLHKRSTVPNAFSYLLQILFFLTYLNHIILLQMWQFVTLNYYCCGVFACLFSFILNLNLNPAGSERNYVRSFIRPKGFDFWLHASTLETCSAVSKQHLTTKMLPGGCQSVRLRGTYLSDGITSKLPLTSVNGSQCGRFFGNWRFPLW